VFNQQSIFEPTERRERPLEDDHIDNEASSMESEGKCVPSTKVNAFRSSRAHRQCSMYTACDVHLRKIIVDRTSPIGSTCTCLQRTRPVPSMSLPNTFEFLFEILATFTPNSFVIHTFQCRELQT
jgi:hypothetical protein